MVDWAGVEIKAVALRQQTAEAVPEMRAPHAKEVVTLALLGLLTRGGVGRRLGDGLQRWVPDSDGRSTARCRCGVPHPRFCARE